MARKKKELAFPLRFTLVTTVVLSACIVIAITIGAMGLPAYIKVKHSFRSLWKDLSKQVSQTATHEVLSFFQSAPITLKFIEGLVQEKTLKLESKEGTFDICYRALKENPSFTAVYYALLDGTFTGVEREKGSYIATYRTVQGPNQTQVEIFRNSPSQEWIKIKEDTSSYDPRIRPFWKTGQKTVHGAWTDPYHFARSKQKGYSYVLGQVGSNGISGFWAVDFEINVLSSFLEKLDIGQRGIITILDEEGSVISESESHTPRKESSQMQDVWKQFQKMNQIEGYIEKDRRIFFFDRFPRSSEIPWTLVTIIHESDFLGPIRKTVLKSFFWGLIPCILFVMLSGIFFGKISNRLKLIAYRIDRFGRLSFEADLEVRSWIKEISMMEKALRRMKVGLKSFSKYVPMDLVKRLLLSGKSASLGGEKKEISILFADLAQFTSLAEKKETDEVVKILEHFLDAATKEVHKQNGIIDKFIGDCVMAIWGAPDPQSDHALRACRMALSLKKTLKTTPFRCGINSGEAMVGNLGSQSRMDYTAIGDSVNLAARLEKVNKIYDTQIVIGPATAAAVKEELLVRRLDSVVIRGRESHVEVYELRSFKKDADEKLIKGFQCYEEARTHYEAKAFSEAIVLFQKTIDLLGGQDIASTLFIKSAEHYKKNGPPEGFSGGRISLNELP